MDSASVTGTLIALVAILGGQALGGGSLEQIFQGTAALIVFGGTLGAMFMAYPTRDVTRAFHLIPRIYGKGEQEPGPIIEEIVRIATLARKEGILAVESQRGTIQDEMLRRAIKYVTDGFEPATVREIIESEIDHSLEAEESAARVFEGGAGIAPSIGILGAVLGLIQVMTLLNDPSRIGQGIASAFVAVVYGMVLANLILLPWSSKLRRKARESIKIKELVLLGVVGIQEGLNPHFLQEKLQVFVEGSAGRPGPGKAR